MRATSILRVLLDLKHVLVEDVAFDEESVVIAVRSTKTKPRCGGCYRGCDRVYDRRERFWRHLDFAGMQVWLRYSIRRVDCAWCGVTTELVPWAEPDSGFTRDFEEQAAFLAQRSDKTTVSSLMRVSWRTVGRIIERVVARIAPADPLADLRRLGIDEISYRKHHEYLTVVTCHDRGCVVWVGEGKSAEALLRFFDALGAARSACLEIVSIDMSAAYEKAVRERAPNATIVFDRFHVQRLASVAVDEVRRGIVRSSPDEATRKATKKTRFALLRNYENTSVDDRLKLAAIRKNARPLQRAYLMKETLRETLGERDVNTARVIMRQLIGWAQRSRLAPFQKLARTLKAKLDGILAYVETGVSNGRVEGLNNKIRTLTKRAYGFHRAESLMSYIKLCCTGLDLAPVRHAPRFAPR
jgi:transposase